MAAHYPYAAGHDDPANDKYYFWMSEYVKLFGAIMLTQTVKVFFGELK